MGSKYFAMLLPTDDEIEIGFNVPIYKNKKLSTFQLETFEKLEKFKNLPGSIETGIKAAKLFLCTIDINIGDHCKWIDDLSAVEDVILSASEYHYSTSGGSDKKRKFFKVLGRISPNVKWVKHMDEFEEKQIQYIWNDSFNYLIKCPCCEDFK